MQELEEFVANHPKGHFMQAPMWADVKKDWKSHTVTVRGDDGAIKGSMHILSRKMPFMPYSMLYCPRGPVCDLNDAETLRELTAAAKKVAKASHAYTLLIDPDVTEAETQFLEIMRGLGYQLKSHKNFEGVQANFVFRLDLAGKTEEEVLAGFHSKTRYNIKLATRKGVTVTLGGREDLPRFYEIMLETGLRDKFPTRSLAYFERIFDCLGDHVRLYLANYEGEIIAGTIALWFGDKTWYLYGASSNASRNVMPNYLLQWQMIRWAMEKGCRLYDLRGVPAEMDENNPLSGLYRFKKGFGGTLTQFAGELELEFKPRSAKMIKKAIKVFFKVRKWAFLKLHRAPAANQAAAPQVPQD
ncbi:MAG: peptidoglycan bridge formation glycyltransferase FemA/FemB family protein [Oscillospiraceae bacterium]|nr:peptidoglycan bridge formation glycyltransferase FemA/FemB family protein [Oscillospiraceae bacterium]